MIKAVKTTSGPGRRKSTTYTSARLPTQNEFSQCCGTCEARIKCDLTTGTWPAWWMIGSDYSQVGWPACGEIDMVEVYGQPGWQADSTVHTADAHNNDTSVEATIPGGVDTSCHIYRLVWRPRASRSTSTQRLEARVRT